MIASRLVTGRFLSAVNDKDLALIADCFTADARYSNVPHPPAIGPAAITALLAPILARSERVEWQIVGAAYDDRRAWLERVDNFWIDGELYSVACNGVFDLDPGGTRLDEVRDYVDLGPWRERLRGVLTEPVEAAPSDRR